MTPSRHFMFKLRDMKWFNAGPRKSRARRHYLVSTAGQPNWGDEFITRAWIRFLAKSDPDSEIWLDCPNPSHSSLLLKDEHPHLHVVNTLWQLVWNTSDLLDDSEAAAQKIRGWIRDGGTPREDFGIDLLRSMDTVHLLGGGYINQLWKANVLLLVALAQLKELNPKVLLYGTGLGLAPLKGIDLFLARTSLTAFDHMSVRDSRSADIAGTERGFDDAFLEIANTGSDWLEQNASARAFVCLQQDVVGRNPKAVKAAVDSLLLSGVEKSEPIFLVEAIPPEDSWSLDLFKDQWPGEVWLLPFSHLWNYGFPNAADTVWISSRFHMHLLGACAGARGIAMGFGNEYYDIKHGSLMDLGTGWANLDVSVDHPAPVSATASSKFPAESLRIARKKKREANQLY